MTLPPDSGQIPSPPRLTKRRNLILLIWAVFLFLSGATFLFGAAHCMTPAVIAFLLFLIMTISLVYLSKQTTARRAGVMRQAKREAWASEIRFTELFNQIDSGVAVYEAVQDGKDFIFRDFNPAGESLDKIKKEDLLGRCVTEVFPGVRDSGLLEALQRVWKTGNAEKKTISFCKEDRSAVWRENSIYKLPAGEIVAVYNDVTENKRIEKDLKENEDKFRTIFASNSAAIAIIEPDTTISMVNNEYCKLSGYTKQEIIGMSWTQQITPDNLERLKEYTRRRLINPRDVPDKYEFTFCRKDGAIRNCLISVALIPDRRNIITSFVDITDLKCAQKDLQESQARFQELFDIVTSGVAVYEVRNDGLSGKDYIIKDFNKKSLQMEGCRKADVVGKSLLDLRPAIDQYGLIAAFRNVWKTGIPESYPQKIYIDEKFANYYENHIYKLPGGEIVAVYNDITERKKDENALRELAEKYRSLAATEDSMYLVDRNGKYLFMNDRHAERFGLLSCDVGGRSYGEFHSEESTTEFIQKVEEVFHSAESIQHEHFSKKEGRCFLRTFTPVKDSRGSITSVTVVSKDITSRKLAEDALRESEEILRVTLENILDPLFITDDEGAFTFVCTNVPFILGYTIKEIQAMENISKLFAKELFVFEELETQGEIHNIECVIVRKDGRQRDFLVTVKRVSIRGGTILYVCHDITGRKIAEEKLRASLQEKEILLREIHHRVKNNMQVISSLLALQSSSSKNPDVIQMSRESQKRIRSMALIHERFYHSVNFARINLGDYVRGLSGELSQAYEVHKESVDLNIQTDRDVFLDIEKAIPCGLILSELISNALRHAFPGDQHGEIKISISNPKNAEIVIIVSDNGVGLPGDVDINQARSVGLHLVNGLVKNQLRGQIELRRDNGTEFRIIFLS